MTQHSPQDIFEQRTPLIKQDDLTATIHDEILAGDLIPSVTSIWVIGSFANPSKELDDNDIGWSDMDLFIVVPDWSYPQADTGIVLEASEPKIPEFVDRNLEGEEWIGVSGPEQWNCSADTAWEKLPEPAQETLNNSVKTGFFRNQEELEEKRVRYFDVFIGTESQLEYQRDLNYDGETSRPGFRLWQSTMGCATNSSSS